MTSEQFIKNVIDGKRTKSGYHSSIYYNGDDIICSYGMHYPLLVKIDEQWYLNDRGYSMTTSKHISWASSYASGSLSMNHGSDLLWNYGDEKYKNRAKKLIEWAQNEIDELNEQLSKLSKRAFRQRQNKIDRIDHLKKTIHLLTPAATW